MMIGKRISGRYKILSHIGGGGMSSVYLAEDMILDRRVAVKILRYDFSNEDELRRRFQREAQSATSLMHPNIVSIYDVGEDGDLYYIVMEYVDGQTLKQYIAERGPIPPAQAVEMMKQLTAAIAYSHESGIIHRDIKPQNILIDGNGTIKITDFGIAMALSATSHTQTNAVLGTVHYLSPEQARGGTATKKSDIYSLGIVLYEMLTGELPFDGESAVSILLKHLQSETPHVRRLQPSVPQSLENVVLKAIAKDAFYRYASVNQMKADLETVLAPERANEPCFSIAVDEGATRAVPAIKAGAANSLDTVALPNDRHSERAEASASASALSKDKKPSKRNRKVWIAAGLTALLLAVLLAVLVPKWMQPKQVAIPSTEGLALDKAVEKLVSLGFAIGPKTEEPSDTLAQGTVIRTDPAFGATAEEGSAIRLFVSSGKEKTELGNFVGRSIGEVKAMLQGMRVQLIETDEQFSDEPKGTILEQSPAAGSNIVPENTAFHFTVSKGKELRAVDDLSGYNEKGLKDYRKTSGFRVSVVREDYSDTVAQGNVLSQTPRPGTRVAPGSEIRVVLSKGKLERPPKAFTQTVDIPYPTAEDPAAEPTPVTVRIYLQDRDHTMAEPAEEFSSTEAVRKPIRLLVDEGETGAYRITVDDKVVAEQSIDYASIE